MHIIPFKHVFIVLQDKIKFEDDIETFENVMVFDKNETNSFDNKNVCSSLSDNLDDYWVQGNKNDSIEISNTSEHVDVSQEIAIAILEEVKLLNIILFFKIIEHYFVFKIIDS